MMKKLFITLLLFTIVAIDHGQGLSCYEHDTCLGGCPSLASTIVSCASSESKCWKLVTPFGVKRGCANNRCNLQIDVGLTNTANVCCPGNLCNSAVSMQSVQTTMIMLMASIIFCHLFYLR